MCRGLAIITDKSGRIYSDIVGSHTNLLTIKNKNEDIPLKLKLEYSDPNNKEYSETVTLPLKLYSSKNAKKYGLVQGSSKVGFVIILIIVGGGIYFYKKRKKKSKK